MSFPKAVIPPVTQAKAANESSSAQLNEQDKVKRSSYKTAIQYKLSIGAPDDPSEKEVEDKTDKVMRMIQPISFSSARNTVNRKCAHCEEEEKQKVQRKENNNSSVSVAPPIVHDVINSPGGRSMDTEPRSFMESRFNYDFSNIKIHDSDIAAKSADSINALAYTSGNSIVFNSGQFNTSSDSGKRLLAHELTHVVQQAGKVSGNISSTQPIIQRFGALEHKGAGDKASQEFSKGEGPMSFSVGSATTSLELTFGDITMLSADLFDPRDTIMSKDGKPTPNPDSLFLIASKPSSNPGLQVGTQDEIIFAIYDEQYDKKNKISTDPRFLKGGMWEKYAEIFERIDSKTKEFVSKDVRKAVNDRYLQLASKNYEHFVQPTGIDKGPGAGLGASAGGSYRALHEDAILISYHAAQKGDAISSAFMREAAAQHFLEDYFSSGHLRTPRKAMDEHWLKKYPLFYENMKKKFALDMAIYINANTTNIVTVFGTVTQIFNNIYAEVQNKTKTLPPIGLGVLLGEVMHHFDNNEGVWVKNKLGHRWLDFGDGNLNKKFQLSDKSTHKFGNNHTPDMINMASKLGLKDIQNAFDLGKKDKTVRNTASILSTTRKEGIDNITNAKDDLYAAELAFPELDTTADNGDISAWQSSSIEELWGRKVRTDKSETYGQLITISIRSGEIHNKLYGLAEEFPKSQVKYASTIYPQAAFINGFIKSLENEPLKKLLSIINYNPSEGQAFFNEDDAVLDEFGAMKPAERKQLTLKQRADRIKSIVDCTFCVVTRDEGEVVIQLFTTASASDRPSLYQMVEGHTWKGDWKHGVFVSDDQIWNGLYKDQLSRLRKVINNQK